MVSLATTDCSGKTEVKPPLSAEAACRQLADSVLNAVVVRRSANTAWLSRVDTTSAYDRCSEDSITQALARIPQMTAVKRQCNRCDQRQRFDFPRYSSGRWRRARCRQR
jgi:hypothetical protein